ncbi:hypothetical protein ACIHFE_25145 [Streptomyces sp. NPDC052396]
MTSHFSLEALQRTLSRPELGIAVRLGECDCLITDDRCVLRGRTS